VEESSEKDAFKGRRFCLLCLWMDGLASLSKSSRRVAIGGVLLAPVVWWADAAVDYFIFSSGESFLESLLHPSPLEIWVRSMAGVMFVIFGTYAAFLLDRAERTELELRNSNAKLEELRVELERLVVVDPLTGVFNRRKFHESLGQAIVTAMRHQHWFALLMLDIDNFKQINDRYGHQVGDDVLRLVCKLVDSSIRSSDQMFRVGGEEFCIVAVALDVEKARVLAEKVRSAVEAYDFPGVGRVTISVGIAWFREGDNQQNLYARADSALYRAKRQGRNCMVYND
jgi:diguanylate cyclase (GGDEF)-like protein